MTLRHISDQQTGITNFDSSVSQYLAFAFTAPEGVPLTHLAYYSNLNSVLNAPNRLWVKNTTDNVWEYQTEDIPPPTAVGWKTWYEGEMFTPEAGKTYMLVGEWINGDKPPYRSWTGKAAAAPGFAYVGTGGLIGTSAPTDGTPSTPWTEFPAISIGSDVVEVGQPGADASAPTNQSISGRLAQWFSSDPALNTQEFDLPWLTHALSVAIDEQVGEVKQLIDALASYGGAIAFGSSDDKLAAIGGVLQAIWTDAPTAGVPRMETSIKTAVEDAKSDLEAVIGGAAALTRPEQDTVSVGDARWIVEATISGSGSFAWQQEADAFIFTVTNPEDLSVGKEISGVPYFKHRSAWAPLDVDIVGDHHTMVGVKHRLSIPGMRLQGVVVHLDPPNIEWTIQALHYNGGA